MSAIIREHDETWSEFNQRYDLAPATPLYGSTGFVAAPAGTLVLSDDEWRALSVAFRFYQHAAGVDTVSGLEHSRVRPLLLGILARKP